MYKKVGRFIFTVLGMTHTGKSAFIKFLLPYFPEPLFILDVNHEYEAPVRFKTMKAFKKWIAAGNYPYRVAFDFEHNADDVELFKLIRYLKRPCTLLIEEAWHYTKPNHMQEDLETLVFRGAHWGINLVFVTQRAATISRSITSQSEVITFRQTESNDLKALKTRSDDAINVSELEPHEFIILGELPKKFNALLTKNTKKSKVKHSFRLNL